MLCLLHALKRAPDADLLLLSAMLTNAPEFAAWIQESTGRICTAYQNPWKPSRQARGVVVYRSQDIANIANSREMIPYGLFGLHQHWNPQVRTDLHLISLSEETVTLTRSTGGWATPNANAVARSLAIQAARSGLKTIVFVQQADYAPANADKIAGSLEAPSALTANEEVLWSAVQAELGGADYSFVQPTKGALPHNGDMIPQERRLAESLFKRDGGASVIVATPTLAQGMNLPAQFAILAGDKRQDAEGRTSLEAHEILNAAGRAGRAGHLANGIVLLISDPVTGFTATGKPDNRSVAKLRKLLPPNDQCVPMDDPLTALLDQIQAGRIDDAAVRYFTSRVQAGEEPTEAAEQAVAMVNRSFAAFKARQAQQNEVFEQKLDALRAVLAKSDSTPAIATIAASTGLSNEPLLAVYSRLAATPTSMPQSVAAWVDWLIAFFASDQASYLSLLGDDADVVRYAVRGKKTGGHPTAAEFSLLNNGLKAWISGKTFHEIELALGVEAKKVKRCPRARDLVLKLANRSFYLIASSVVEVAKVVLAEHHLSSTQPAVLETLAVAIRKGIDTPDKIAFGYRRPALRSRVLVHRDFAAVLGAPMNTTGLDYETVLAHTTARLAFATLS